MTEMAERVGFEPTVPEGTTVFETARINHSRISPRLTRSLDQVVLLNCLTRRLKLKNRKSGMSLQPDFRSINVVPDEGIEPPTPSLGRRRSIR